MYVFAPTPQAPPIILVSTPMRLVASLRGGHLKLGSVELVVLDEADRLFELGCGGSAYGTRKTIAEIVNCIDVEPA